MYKKQAAIVVVALSLAAVAIGLFAGPSASPAPSAAENERAMKKSFAALQKELPDLLKGWLKEEMTGRIGELQCETKLSRWTCPTEMKLIVSVAYKEDLFQDGARNLDRSMLLSFLLRYNDRKWTTLDACSSEPKSNIPALMLAIDQADSE